MIRCVGWPERWQLRLDRALLHAVCQQSHCRVRWLLALGANPNVTGWCDLGLVSALSAACIHHEPEIVRWLLHTGANRDGSKNEPHRPIDLVAESVSTPESLTCLRWLILAGSDPRLPDDHGLSAVDRAVLEGNMAKLALLHKTTG